jgi:hypothetical protein
MLHFRDMKFLLALMTALHAPPALGCSAFLISQGGESLVADRFDFSTNDGLVVAHLRGQAKQALIYPTFKGSPAKWIAKWGSVTFGIMGAQLPFSGMNENGLVVKSLRDSEAIYAEKRDSRPYINNRQVYQYLLDQAADLPEALDLLRSVRVQDVFRKNRMFLCDRLDRCAVVEFMRGQLKIYQGQSLPTMAITNAPYEDSLHGKDGDGRFTVIARRLRQVEPTRALPDYALETLDKVAMPGLTGWEVLYDRKERQVAFRSPQAPALKTVAFKSIDFSPRGKVLMLNIHERRGGDVTSMLRPYDPELDAKLLRTYMNGIGQFIEKRFPGITASVLTVTSHGGA